MPVAPAYIKEAIMDLNLTVPQTEIYTDTTRFRTVVAGRRFGKSYLSGAELVNAAIGLDKITGQPKSKQTVVYIAPTFQMCKGIMWAWLKEHAPKQFIKKQNETELLMEFKNGSTIQLRSGDNYDSLRGLSLSFVVIDEVADIHPDAWSLVVRPALSDQEGDALFIGTPKQKNHFYDKWLEGKNPERETWASFQYTTLEGGNVSANEVNEARYDLSPREFRQEYEASFESMSNRVIDSFDIDKNVKRITDLGGELLIGMDFNVNPMTAVVGQRVGNTLQIFKDYKLPNSNTKVLMDKIEEDFAGREIVVFPDPSGKSRKTSAIGGQTDHDIIRSYGVKVVSPRKAPHTADSINAVNVLMLNGAGDRRCLIDPSCSALIKDLDSWTYDEKSLDSRPDKKRGNDHLPDALKYLVWSEYKIAGSGNTMKQVEIKGF